MEDFVDFLSVPPQEEGGPKGEEVFSEEISDEAPSPQKGEGFPQGAEKVEEMWVKVNKKGEVIDKIDVECLCGRKISIVFNYDTDNS